MVMVSGELGVPTRKGKEPLAYLSTRFTDEGVVIRVMLVYVEFREAEIVAPAK